MIEEYLDEFERRLVGPADRVVEIRTELASHLHAAAEAGELEVTLARLGPPGHAAAVFSEPSRLVAAPLKARIRATAIDLVPLVVVTIARMALDLRLDQRIVVTFPPLVTFGPETSVVGGLLVAVGLAWSVFGLAVLEVRSGHTPGKAMMGLRVVDERGRAVTLRQSVLRRASLLLGPLAWLDVGSAPLLGRRRLTERLSRTLVISEARR